MSNRIAVIGYFNNGESVSDGQGVKTAILTEELEKISGCDNVDRIDTAGWKKHPVRLLMKCLRAVRKNKNVVFLTDYNGIRVFPRMLELFNFRRKCSLHYYVVGGWLTDYLKQNPQIEKALKKLDAIYVEIPSMAAAMTTAGFSNVVTVNKFRRLNPLGEDALRLNPTEPYKLCYFSRVMKEKGVEDAIAAVKKLNAGMEKPRYMLDIFGAVDPQYTETFDSMQKDFPEYIEYCGIVDFRDSTGVLKKYFAMLFPTFYKSEGYPNTVVDAFAAGLPIIATRWHYNAEIINDRVDGMLVDVGNVEQIVSAVKTLSKDSELYKKMRINCLKRCTEYQPEKAVQKIVDRLQ